jgi:Zn-finger nucleic acid-binding protein
VIYRGAHPCVACGTPLVADQVWGAPCERCARCGGLWFDTAAFLSLLATSPTAQHIEELMVHNDGSPRRGCPSCAQLMDLAWIDFLQLDQCAEHGVWLDAGELERALASALPNPELKALVEALKPKKR